jgi:hypothetical protein
MCKQSGVSMDGHHHPSIAMTIYLNTTERETKMAKRTDARRIRAYYKKHPAAKPKDVAAALGVNIANVYYVRKTMRDKDVVDLTIAGSPLRPKIRLQGSSMREHYEFGNSNVDLVNSPPHYTTGGIETIDFIEAKQLNYNLGNVVKYITRADHKGNRVEDLRKAKWYLEREILSQHI